MITGTVLGVILAVILNTVFAGSQPAGPSILGYLVVFIGGLGFGLGSLVALLLDRVFRARSQTLEATKLEGVAAASRPHQSPPHSCRFNDRRSVCFEAMDC